MIRQGLGIVLLAFLPSIALGAEVVGSSTTTTVQPLGLGVNTGVQRHSDNKDYWHLAGLTGTTMVRYPSGTPSSFWDWKNTGFFDAETGVKRLKDRPVWMTWVPNTIKRINDDPRREDKYSMPAFQQFADSFGAEVSWILNVATDTPESLKEQVDYALANGIRLKYVELGNELNGASFAKRFPTFESYYQQIKPVVDHIRKVSPETKIAIPTHVGSHVSSDANNTSLGGSRDQDWEHRALHNTDGLHLVHHSYLGPNASKIIAREIFLEDEDKLPEFYLAAPYHLINEWESVMAEQAPEKKIWLTEYNLWTLSPDVMAWKDSMVYGLVFAHWWMRLLESPSIEMAHYHDMESTLFGLFSLPSGWDGFMENSGSYDEGKEDFSKVLTYPQMALLSQISQAAKNATEIEKLELKNAPQLEPRAYWTYQEKPSAPGIVARVYQSPEKTTLVVLNLTNKQEDFVWEALKERGRSGLALVAKDEQGQPLDGLTPIRSEANLLRKSGPLVFPLSGELITQDNLAQGNYTLAPYSLTLIQLDPQA